MEHRYIPMSDDIQTRSADGEKPVIEGYFARFDTPYYLFDGATESIARGAFTDCINDDVRALYNHNTDIVLARTSAGTMEIKQDDMGLWGRVEIDPDDTDAMNVYRRIARRSITGCSFGFEIEDETRTVNPDGSVHWTINKVSPLYEISPTAFPAYEATSVVARKKEFDSLTEEAKKRKNEAWRETMKARLKHGTESTAAEEEA